MNTANGDAIPPVIPPPIQPSTSIAAKLRVAPFVLALLGFLLPFVKLSCALDARQHVSIEGTKLLIGGELGPESNGRDNKIEPQPWVIAGCALIGFGLLLTLCSQYSLAVGAALAAGGALVWFLMDLAATIKTRSKGAVVVNADLGLILVLTCLVGSVFLCGHLARKPKLAQPG
jgi:hypothetical protein